jgi:hypothetical protein
VVKIISRGLVSHLLDIKAIESKAAYRKRGFLQITRFSLPTGPVLAEEGGWRARPAGSSLPECNFTKMPVIDLIRADLIL